MWYVSGLLACIACYFFGVNGEDVGVPKSEFEVWRGRANVTDEDLLQAGNWVAKLNATDLVDALKYYWISNEVMYAYGGFVRSSFAVFNVSLISRKTPVAMSFLLGSEVVIHYLLLKSFPVIGRRGGIRGNGQDKMILKAAIEPLKNCYTKFEPKEKFSTSVYPSQRRKRQLFSIHNLIGRKLSSSRRIREITEVLKESDDFNPNQLDLEEEADKHELDRRYTYTLSHGTLLKTKKTNIVLNDEGDKAVENIAVSLFWLIYETIPGLCDWLSTDMNLFKEAFEKIVGLVLSMFLFDTGDFAEEYERIFRMTTKQYETEWERMESLARTIRKEKKITLYRPYSYTV